MTAVQELEQLVESVGAQVGPAVVRIGRGPGRGSGVVVGNGLILTNAHNLRGQETTVTFADRRQVLAEIRGVDVDSDLAVLAADTGTTAAPEWAQESPGHPGPVVVALARAGEGLRVTWGTVSAVAAAFRGPRGRRITGSIEHTAPLARGSSGGPIVDAAGRLIGINTNRLADGFYLAVPTDAALRDKVDSLARGESPNRRRLGVGLAPAHVARRLRRSVGLAERDGLLVRAVVEGSPAARAGLRTGDLLVAAASQPLTNADELYEALDGAEDTLLLTVVRGVEELTVTISFAEAGATKEEGSA